MLEQAAVELGVSTERTDLCDRVRPHVKDPLQAMYGSRDGLTDQFEAFMGKDQSPPRPVAEVRPRASYGRH